MDKNKLIRFFEGVASTNEEVAIRQWLDSSPENILIFNSERALYNATLFLSNSNLSTKRIIPTWILSAAAAIVITLIMVGSINYILERNSGAENYNTVIVPPGQRVNILLSDKSNVWINANSKFIYPSQFKKGHRIVHLDGEAFFEVKSDKKNPFIVKTSHYDVKATGTTFNLEAYSKNKSFEIALFEGRVDCIKDNVVSLSLLPQERAILTGEKLSKSTIDDQNKYLWRRGLIAFNDAKLEDILLSLEKCFDTKIVVESTHLPQYTYSGKLRQSDGIDYSLRVLQRSMKFDYKRDELTGVITIK